MTHKLHIEFETGPETVVQGDSFTVTLNILNIGDQIFPGGTFSYFRVKYIGGDASQSALGDLEIPEIPVENSWSITKTLYAISDGISWVEAQIKSNDEEVIEYYQSRRGPVHQEWSMPFYVQNRESYDIISLLQKILEKLDEINEKLRGQAK